MALTVLSAVFTYNYLRYIKYHAMYGIQPRYLLSALPIIIVMAVVAINFMLKKNRYLKLVILLIVFLMLTQGGGVITHILRSKDSWYWENSTVIEVNNVAKKILRPLVKEY